MPLILETIVTTLSPEGEVHLVPFLHMLAPEKILDEMRYLAIAVSKTAGPREREAWDWIEDKVAAALGRDDRVLANPLAASDAT